MITAAAKAAVDEARVETAEEVGVTAQRNAPVRTGELRDSMQVEHEGNVSRVGFTAPHAGFVEFGTSRMASQPYLIPAAWQGKETLRKKILEKLKKLE